jgi:hypothetical protein
MDYELIFWIILGAVSTFCLLGAWLVPSDRIDITDRKRNEWAREERKWR